MSVTCGFYDSLNGDRKYYASDMSKIFDGLIIDGVFASIGDCFVVKATTGQTVNVGIGKAWFNHTWTLNDAILPMEAPDSEVLLNRIDAIVLEINATDSVRDNSIKFIQGEPASEPVRPTLTNDWNVHQYPLCYIYRAAGSTEITQAEITNMVGTDETPFVTGILQTISLDELLGQWRTQLDRFVANESADIDSWTANKEAEMLAWFENLKSDLLREQQALDEWIASEQSDFMTWFNSMKDQLSTDAAGSLQNQIDREEVERILLSGFVDGTKVFSDDGTVITSTASDGRTLTKTFTNGFRTMTTVLTSSTGSEIARMVKTFDSTGKNISTEVTYS